MGREYMLKDTYSILRCVESFLPAAAQVLIMVYLFTLLLVLSPIFPHQLCKAVFIIKKFWL